MGFQKIPERIYTASMTMLTYFNIGGADRIPRQPTECAHRKEREGG